ncbi:MAG: porin [Myxococcota bacterium]
MFAPELQYVLQLAVAGRDFRDGATSPLFDAFVDWKLHRDVSVKVGQFFVPFDRLRTVREFALQMTDRPRPVLELTLDRDVGMTLYSDHLGADRSPLAYRLGVFGGGGTNRVAYRPAGVLVVGRVELRPLGEIDDDSEGDLQNRARPGLALGGGLAGNVNTDRLRSTTGPSFEGGTVDYLHGAADLTFKWRGFALQGEYLYKDALEDRIAFTDDDGANVEEWGRSGHGWVVQASYHLEPGIEVVGRTSRLYALPDTDPAFAAELAGKRSEVGAGLNWYRNGHRFKVQTTWIALFGHDLANASHTVSTQVDAMF